MKAKTMWLKQFGTDYMDFGRSIALDSARNIYIGGTSMERETGKPDSDETWLAKFSPGGHELWRCQFGRMELEERAPVVLDTFGDVLCAGLTKMKMGDDAYKGGRDLFLAKFSPDGAQKWLRQVGTHKLENYPKITSDSRGCVYLAGGTSGKMSGDHSSELDVFLMKFSPDGEELWRCQLGTDGRESPSWVTTDESDNVYLVGTTNQNIRTGERTHGKTDVFVVKYTPEGEELWSHQFGTPTGNERAYALEVDPLGNFYLTGYTDGDFAGTQQGNYDAWVAKYAPDWSELWSKQFGTEKQEIGYALKLDSLGNVYVGGGRAMWIKKFNHQGEEVWNIDLSSYEWDYLTAMETDGAGNIYVTGATMENLQPGTTAAKHDVILAKCSEVPESFEELNDLNYLRFIHR